MTNYNFVSLFPVGGDGLCQIYQTGQATSLTSAENQPTPSGGSVIVLADGVAPPNFNQKYDPTSQTFVDNLAAFKTSQIKMLNTSCGAAIVGGFTSSALGLGAYTYASDPIQQSNILSCAAVGGLLACCPPGGSWSKTAHTPTQATQVLTDFSTMRDTNRTKLDTLTAEVNAATTVAAVQAITW